MGIIIENNFILNIKHLTIYYNSIGLLFFYQTLL